MEYKKRCLFSEVEDIISEMAEECLDEAVAEQGEDYRVMVTNPFIYMPSRNLYFAPMEYYEMNEEGEYEIDWDGTAVFKLEGGLLKLICYEQDTPILTANNLLYEEGKTLDICNEKVTIMMLADLVDTQDTAAKEEIIAAAFENKQVA